MFAEFIKSSGLRQSEWAERIGCSRSYLSEILSGKKRPSLEVACRIEDLTEGKVPASSWMRPTPDIPQEASNG